MNTAAADFNSRGEIAGRGAEWACAAYGTDGHDYNTCPDCLKRFRFYMQAKLSIKKETQHEC
jgi:hypothetical protein